MYSHYVCWLFFEMPQLIYIHLSYPWPSLRPLPKISIQLPTKTDASKYSFFPSSIRIWNSLPSDIVEAETLDLFKISLNM